MMEIQLTQQEEEHLIWQDGDYYEGLPGHLTISLQQSGRSQFSSEEVLQVTFFLESDDPAWGTQEWDIIVNGKVPEGPVMLVLYRRGRVANVFGVISMMNGAWIHATPLLSVNLFAQSTKAAELKQLEIKSLAKSVGFGLLPKLFGGGAEKARQSSYREEAYEIEAAARAFMFRLVNDIKKFWQSAGKQSGRL